MGQFKHVRSSLRQAQDGFSLVEIVTIMALVAVLSLFALAKFNQSHTRIQYQTAIQKIRADIRLAQQLALSEGKATRVYIDQSYNRYYLKWEDGNYIENLIGGGNFIVQFGTTDFSGVSITASELSNGRLDFTTAGLPENEGQPFSGELNVVTLNSATQLQIAGNTGFISIEDL